MELFKNFLNPWLILVALIGAPLLAEFSGYVWHRWVTHWGIFRGVFHDFLRSRHYDHHESPDKYPVGNLRSVVYRESCELAFRVLMMVLSPLLLACVLTGLISIATAAAIVVGGSLYSYFLQSRLHDSYHIENSILYKKNILFRLKWVRQLHAWLRDCHDIHHWKNANYFILIPAFDWLFGTLLTKKKMQAQGIALIKEDLFPKFNPQLVGTCGTPIKINE